MTLLAILMVFVFMACGVAFGCMIQGNHDKEK